jgi:ABC-type glycerol-3-phosphate transport system substrate-binding protein
MATVVLLFMSAACAQSEATPEIQPQLFESIASTPTRPPERTAFPTEEILRGTVTIRHSWDESQIPVLAQIIKSFQTYQPDVMFDVLYIPAETLYERYEADTSEGLGPTLLFGPAEWGPMLFQSGLTADLTSLIDASLLKSINQPALGAARLENALVGVPYAMQGTALFRNKEVVTIKAETFDELVALAQTSTQGKTVGAYLERSFFYSGGHLDGLGGQLIDKNHRPGFNNGKGVAWLELLKDFEQAGPTNYFNDDDLERFKLGQIGWIIDGTWNLRTLADTLGADKLAIDPWPTYKDGHLSGYVMAENVYLCAKAQEGDRRAALKFIEFLLMPEAQTRIAESGRIPVSSRINPIDPVYGSLVVQAVQALAGGATYPVGPEMAAYNLSMDLALRAYFEQELPPEQVLQSAQEAVLAELAK